MCTETRRDLLESKSQVIWEPDLNFYNELIRVRERIGCVHDHMVLCCLRVQDHIHPHVQFCGGNVLTHLIQEG